jgi:hypothetical protein
MIKSRVCKYPPWDINPFPKQQLNVAPPTPQPPICKVKALCNSMELISKSPAATGAGCGVTAGCGAGCGAGAWVDGCRTIGTDERPGVATGVWTGDGATTGGVDWIGGEADATGGKLLATRPPGALGVTAGTLLDIITGVTTVANVEARSGGGSGV